LAAAQLSVGANIGFMVGGAVLMGGGGLMMKQNQPTAQSGAETFWTLTESTQEPVATNKPPTLQDPGFKDPKNTPENNQERAAKLYDEAKAHYNLQEYDTALSGFKDAYLLSKEPGLLFNIGQCYRQMGKEQEAIRSFKAYLNEDPESPQRPQIEQWLKEMGSK
jgi:tetratricopeptide (TPR) repeat protein